MLTRIHHVAADTLGLSHETLNKLLLIVVILILFWALRAILSSVIHRRISDVSRRYVAQKSANYALGLIAFATILRVMLGGVTGLAAYFGLLSAGLAIALQVPLTNFVGWIFISTRKPFAVGDRIAIGDHAGDVIDIRLFQFSIVEIGNWVDADQSTGRIIHIPNGSIFRDPQANYTQGFNFIWNEVPVTVTFESDWERAKTVLKEIAEHHAAIRSEKAAEQVRKAARKYLIFFEHLTPIVWTSVADIGVTLTIRYLCEPRQRRSTETKIWEEVLTAFAAEDCIDFAYPTTRFYNNAAEGKPGARAETTPGDPRAG